MALTEKRTKKPKSLISDKPDGDAAPTSTPDLLSPKRKQLTPQQRAFVTEYLVDLHGGKAAVRAGYPQKTCSRTASRLLHHTPAVKEAIAKAVEERARRTEVTADRVVQQLARVAFADLKDVVEFGPGGVTIKDGKDVDGTILSEISKISYKKGGGTVRVRLSDRMTALELLGRHLGIYPEKVDIKVEGKLTFEEQLKGLLDPNAKPNAEPDVARGEDDGPEDEKPENEERDEDDVDAKDDKPPES